MSKNLIRQLQVVLYRCFNKKCKLEEFGTFFGAENLRTAAKTKLDNFKK